MDRENTMMEERQVSLWDLMVEILSHWRVLLIAMLIGGISFGGFSYVRSIQNVNTQRALLNEQEEKGAVSVLEEKLSKEQKNSVSTAILYRRLYEEKLAYRQNSALMQIDPFHVQRAELTFWVESDDLKRTYNIQKVYEDNLVDIAACDYVKAQCNIDDVEGLIFLEQPTYDHQQESNIVRVQLVHGDTETCHAMADAIVQYVEQLHSKLSDCIGEHDIVLLRRSQGETVNTYILSQQQNSAMEILAAEGNYIRAKNALSDAELQYYEYMWEAAKAENSAAGSALRGKAGDDTDNNPKTQNTAEHIMRPRPSSKYIILGMILFGATVVFGILVLYIMNNRIRSTDNLQQLYHISQLGLITSTPKKRIFSVLDRWVVRLRYHCQRRFGSEESLNLATVSIKMMLQKRNLNHICLAGCDLTRRAQALCEQIRDRLKEENITVEILNNVLYDAEAMEKLQEMDYVVLVETAGATLYDEIVEELCLLSRQNIQVLGGVMVE